MTFKPAIWYPIATVLSVLNLVAVWFAAAPAEPWHATTHAALAVAFGLWALRLRQRTRDGGAFENRLAASDADASRVEVLDAEVTTPRRELGEAQERLDFADRLLADRREARRVDPER